MNVTRKLFDGFGNTANDSGSDVCPTPAAPTIVMSEAVRGHTRKLGVLVFVV